MNFNRTWKVSILINRILSRQVHLGLAKAWIWITAGAIVSIVTCYISLPHYQLLQGVAIASVALTVMLYWIAIVEGFKREIIWILLLVTYAFIMEYSTESTTDVLQLAGLTLMGGVCLTMLFLRFFQYLNVKRNFPNYLDQSLVQAVLFPRYGRGFTEDSSALEAVNTILRVRKGNLKAADLFSELVGAMQRSDSAPITLGRFREVVTNSNLEISERQFDYLFSYKKGRFFNRIFNKNQSKPTAEAKPDVLKKGDRVKCIKNEEWGVGEVLINGDNRLIWVYFVGAGVKRIAASHQSLVKVRGKEASHPDLKNLHFSKAELGITEYFGYKDYLEKNSRPALLLSKVYDDTASLSFFGGKPIAPIGFEWPKSEYWGKQRCMQFLAQIDLRNAQFAGIEGMPTDGILYFFIDENIYEGANRSPAVFYVNDNLHDLHPVEQQGEPSSTTECAGDYEAQQYSYADKTRHRNFPTVYYPKFEMRMAHFTDVRHPYGVYSNYMFEIGRKNYDDLEKQVNKLESVAIRNALNNIHGREAASKALSDVDLRTARIIDPNILTKETDIGDRAPGVSLVAERWPHTWLHVSTWLSDRYNFGAERGYFMQLPNAPLKRKFLEGCEKLMLKAEQKGPFTPLREEERNAIRKWASGMFLKSLQIWHEKGDEDERKVAYRIWNFLRFSIDRSIREATPRCLDLEQPDRALINSAEREDFLPVFELIENDRFFARHQMFGYGTNVQNAAEEHIDKVLLLQLYSDGAMSWLFGDVGAVQYWISKDDLKHKRFDKVIVTLEGG